MNELIDESRREFIKDVAELFTLGGLVKIFSGCSRNSDSDKNLENKCANVPSPEPKPEIQIGGFRVYGTPEDREVAHIGKDDKGIWYYVDIPKDIQGYENYRVFMGPGNNMKELEVGKVEMYRDGGTTYIDCFDFKGDPTKTRYIQLFFPTRTNRLLGEEPLENPTVTFKHLPTKDAEEFEVLEKRPLTDNYVKNGTIYAD